MRKLLTALLIIPIAAMATSPLDSEFVLIREGEIHPAGAVATVEDITANAVQAIAVAQSASIVSNAAAEVQAMVNSVADIINSVEGIGYIRGYALDFGVAAEDISTNTTATIIRYDHDVARDGDSMLSDVYVYFSEEPATLPVLQWAGSPRTEATWSQLESVSTTLTQTMVDNILWDAYKIRVKVPIALSEAFFRVFATAQQQQTGAFLPVRNGIKVGSYEPLTAEFTSGTNTFKFVGGVRVQ